MSKYNLIKKLLYMYIYIYKYGVEMANTSLQPYSGYSCPFIFKQVFAFLHYETDGGNL